jgi:hypothetical protein
MFLVGDKPEVQANQIRNWLSDHPSVALLVAATYFEWTLCRVLIGLSTRPNMAVRRGLANVFGLPRYKDFWKSELGHLSKFRCLPEAVKDWKSVTDAFDARNRVVHGRTYRVWPAASQVPIAVAFSPERFPLAAPIVPENSTDAGTVLFLQVRLSRFTDQNYPIWTGDSNRFTRHRGRTPTLGWVQLTCAWQGRHKSGH